VDVERDARIVELANHPFYVATLFLPQISSRPERPHPLIVAYLRAVLTFRASQRNTENKR
jgi:CTP synthase (UTP-ammonia lyase)